jgi:flagellar motor switch protein FliM
MAQEGEGGEAVVSDESQVLKAPRVEDNLGETQGLLRDVAAPVVVELGRIQLSITQVARLRNGQILRLPRGPNDPVDLVVNGKLFARGELIEVDGELGVRLLQVTGAS